MKSPLSKLTGALLSISAISSLCAQQLLESNYGVAELQYLQAEDGSDGAAVAKVVTELNATVPSNSEAYIPLGFYRYGVEHQISISMEGSGANSSGSFIFSNRWKDSVGPHVFLENKYTFQSRYKVMYYKSWEVPGGEGHNKIGLVLKVKNVGGDAKVKVRYEAPSVGHWWYHSPDQKTLDGLEEIEPSVLISKGYGGGDEYSKASGVYVDGSPVLTESSGLSYLDDHVRGHYLPLSSSNGGSLESFLLEGAVNGAGRIPKEGAGTRMMWYPEKAAFRVGGVNGSQWNESNVGKYSVAMGSNTQALGDYSTALGASSKALGRNSTALGRAQANGTNSVALGGGSTFSDNATATAWGVASGHTSTAMGTSVATATFSTAMGKDSLAGGYNSTAFGGGMALGYNSTAIGPHSEASGDYSTAMGGHTTASGYASLAIGQYNESRSTVAGQTAWTEIDQNSVLEVGIGSESNPNRNALTVMKDGSVELGKATDDTIPLRIKADGSVVLAKAQGDISMGIYGQ